MSAPLREAALVRESILARHQTIAAEYDRAAALMRQAGVDEARVRAWERLRNAQLVVLGETNLFHREMTPGAAPRKGGAS